MGDRVTLTIKDQVNVKFDDLPPEVRRKISEACKYTVPYARHTPQFKLGRWDGKVAFAEELSLFKGGRDGFIFVASY